MYHIFGGQMVAKNVLKFSFFLIFSSPLLVACDNQLTIVTYNIRYKTQEIKPERLWGNRVGKIVGFIKNKRPDIIGLQEPILDQIKDLDSALSGLGYQWFGQGMALRSKPGMNEYCAIFYNTEKLTRIDLSDQASDTFWINPVGDDQKQTGRLKRICTWGLFKVNNSGKYLALFNTHLDHESEVVRVNQLEVLMDKLDSLLPLIQKTVHAAVPVFLIGDFNQDLTPEIKGALPEFIDARLKAQAISGLFETHASWSAGGPHVGRFDHILLKEGSKVSVEQIHTYADETYSMSDHRPVIATILL
jgi:endonuclease/exonuclease/phosphatase family metal-dependent hydrolase